MAKNISSGIEQLVGERSTPTEKQLEQHEKAWRDLRNKLDSLLIGTNAIKNDEIRKQCQDLDSLNHENRYEHITAHWGKQYAERAKPMLYQLDALEKVIAKLKAAK